MIQLFYDVDGRPQVYSLLKEEVSIGRSSENDVVLNDFSVSRKHAILVKEKDDWVLKDNHSTNGVRVNGKALPQSIVKDGDQISVGTFTLRMRDDPSIATYPRPAGKKDSTSTFIRPLAEFNEEWLAGAVPEEALRPEAEAALDGDGESVLSGAERDALRRMLESCQWNVSAAAARLHISRRTIYRKIHRHGLLRHAPHLGAAVQESD